MVQVLELEEERSITIKKKKKTHETFKTGSIWILGGDSLHCPYLYTYEYSGCGWNYFLIYNYIVTRL